MAAAPPRRRAAVFGKLPSHGDFICRGMSDGERGAWDKWTTAELAAAQGALGDAFDAAHSLAPAWNFIGGPGVFGAAWRVGAFAPSADSVGRRFLIVTLFDDLTWGEALQFGPQMAQAQIDAIYRMLAEGLDADRALSLLTEYKNDGAPCEKVFAKLAAPAAEGVWWTAGGEQHEPAIETGATPPTGFLVRALTPNRTLP